MSNPVCAKCHTKHPIAPREQPLWCAACYGLPVDPQASGGSNFSVVSRTNWKGGRVRGAPRPEREVQDAPMEPAVWD